MPIKALLGPELPYLRRYARALTGSQSLGDAAVRETLEALLEAPHEFDVSREPRLELYRVFHRVWQPRLVTKIHDADDTSSLIGALPFTARQALLLSSLEGFSAEDVAIILGVDAERIRSDVAFSLECIAHGLKAAILIIEDEPIIAMHLKAIVEQVGHTVTGVARTKEQAVALAAQYAPDLILADINLADGSSGIDAVNEILRAAAAPVIFITAYPERLLTGERPEPTYLMTKPFTADAVSVAIGHALLFQREHQSQAEAA